MVMNNPERLKYRSSSVPTPTTFESTMPKCASRYCGISSLRGSALLQRADETQQENAGEIHRNALKAGGQAEAKQ
jgi:hypothetical protein